MPQFGALPGDALVLSRLLRRKLFLSIPTARAGRSRSAQPHIGTRTAEQVDTVQRRTEQRAGTCQPWRLRIAARSKRTSQPLRHAKRSSELRSTRRVPAGTLGGRSERTSTVCIFSFRWRCEDVHRRTARPNRGRSDPGGINAPLPVHVSVGETGPTDCTDNATPGATRHVDGKTSANGGYPGCYGTGSLVVRSPRAASSGWIFLCSLVIASAKSPALCRVNTVP